MIDFGLNIRNNAIIVDRTFAKFQKYQGTQSGLIVRNSLGSLAPAIEPFTQMELAALAALPLNGVLEVAGLGRGGPRGATTQVRIVLIMHIALREIIGLRTTSQLRGHNREKSTPSNIAAET